MSEYETHLFSYRFEGADWGFEIVARDADEAKARLKALAWAKYDGVLVARISAGPGVGWFVRAAVAVRNVLSGPARN